MVFGNRSLACCALLLGHTAAALHPFKHEAIEFRRRQADSSQNTLLQTSTAGSVLTYVTPSPGASPIPITQQSQLVSSDVPEFTLCVLPPEAFFPASATQTTAPYQNYSISIPPGQGTCTTIYSPTVTMVCATTLTGIARLYTVSNCNQEITFSTDHGYILVTPSPTTSTQGAGTNATAVLITPAPTIQTLTTYFMAPWTDLSSANGAAPTDVTHKICTTYANNTDECIVEFYVWQTSLVTVAATTTTAVNLTTTIAGPSQLIVETFVANVTEIMTTFELQTVMELTYSVETETTEAVRRIAAAASASALASSDTTATATATASSSFAAATAAASTSTGPTVTQTYTLNPVAAPSTM
jgi:hypothetical protein